MLYLNYICFTWMENTPRVYRGREGGREGRGGGVEAWSELGIESLDELISHPQTVSQAVHQ